MTREQILPTSQSKRSLCERAAHYEWLLCSMGDLWGRIKSPCWWGIWWLVRHGIYAGLATVLLLLVPAAILYVAIVLLLAHVYKFGRFAVLSSQETHRNTQKSSVNREAGQSENDTNEGKEEP